MSQNSDYALASLTVQTFLPIIIWEYRQRGGPTDLDWESIKTQFDTMMAGEMENGKEVWAGGAGTVVRIPGVTRKEMAVLLETLAVMSFLPGGIEFCDVRYFGNESDRVEWENLQKMHTAKATEPV